MPTPFPSRTAARQRAGRRPVPTDPLLVLCVLLLGCLVALGTARAPNDTAAPSIDWPMP